MLPLLSTAAIVWSLLLHVAVGSIVASLSCVVLFKQTLEEPVIGATTTLAATVIGKLATCVQPPAVV